MVSITRSDDFFLVLQILFFEMKKFCKIFASEEWSFKERGRKRERERDICYGKHYKFWREWCHHKNIYKFTIGQDQVSS